MPRQPLTGPPGSYLDPEQERILLLNLGAHRVHQKEGQSHMEAWDIRAMLTRVFGFGRWSEEALEPTRLVYEVEAVTANGKPAFDVCYRADRRLYIHSPNGTLLAYYDASATGSMKMPDFKRGDLHDFCMKKAESQALKRCAINLGTQFGLSLYRDGQRDDVVKIAMAGLNATEPSEGTADTAEAQGPGVGAVPEDELEQA